MMLFCVDLYAGCRVAMQSIVRAKQHTIHATRYTMKGGAMHYIKLLAESSLVFTGFTVLLFALRESGGPRLIFRAWSVVRPSKPHESTAPLGPQSTNFVPTLLGTNACGNSFAIRWVACQPVQC